jgi:high-affinity iron transporter
VFAAFFSTFQEGLGAFLTVALTLAFLRKSGSRRLVPAVQWGIALSVVISVLAAWTTSGAVNQELWEGVLALVAAAGVVVLAGYVWRTAGHVRRAGDDAMFEHAHGGAMWLAFLGLTILVLARQGMDTALLLATLVFQMGAIEIIVAAVAGTAAAVAVSWTWARHAHHLRARVFFPLTVLLLSLVAVQLVRVGVERLGVASADAVSVVR